MEMRIKLSFPSWKWYIGGMNVCMVVKSLTLCFNLEKIRQKKLVGSGGGESLSRNDVGEENVNQNG